jgi:hypothetical protein
MPAMSPSPSKTAIPTPCASSSTARTATKIWPGNNQDYYLSDGETKSIPLSCDDGESICYGAWVDGDEGTYWGVGPGNTERCDDCCYTCSGGETEEIDLVP